MDHAQLRRMNQQELMAWIPTASLKELRSAQSSHVDSGTLQAIQTEIHAREQAASTSHQFRIATGIAIVALAVSIAATVIALLKP
jgi:hypothetical protein